jgi:hypothetical protein
MHVTPDGFRRWIAVLVLFPALALATSDAWMVTGGRGPVFVEHASRGADGARAETLDASRFRQALENGTRIRCPRGSWLALQPPGGASQIMLRGGELDLVTGPLRPSSEEVRTQMEVFRKHFSPGGVRRGSPDRPVCWPDSSDTVWASVATLVLASPIDGRVELRARPEQGTGRSLTVKFDMGGDLVDADTLRAWLHGIQDSERAVRVAAELRYPQGAFGTTFILAPASQERRGLSRVPPDSSGSAQALLSRALAWLRGRQYPAASREAERAAILLQSLDAYALADTIRMAMGCR